MFGMSPGPYRDELDAQMHRLDAVSQELGETQESLALERAENKLLRAENYRLRGRYGVSRIGLILVACLRWGARPVISALAGMAFMAMMLVPNSRPEARGYSPHRRAPRTPPPTMIVPTFMREPPTTRPCYIQQMCHESCPQTPVWTWGGESYEIEVELVIIITTNY
jgi:hypothetical protein